MTGFGNASKLKKHAALWSVIVLLSLTLTACTQSAQQDATPTPTQSGENAEIELTLVELAEYNGKDGKPAYVAVDGVIYDMTDSGMWKNGEHNGFSAGQDLTDVIKNQSPHGVGKLSNVPAVGKIKE